MARKKTATRLIVKERWREDRRCIRGIRVSEGRDRGHTRISEDVQDQGTLGLAMSKSLTTVHVYQEIGISGDSDREDLNAAIAMIERHEAAWLVINELDRLGRDILDIYKTIEAVHAAGGCVLVNEPTLNSADETSNMVIAVLASLAQSQRLKIGKKWSTAQDHAWDRGVFPGALPYGFRNLSEEELPAVKPGHPTVQHVPDQVAKIRQAAQLLVDDNISWRVAGEIMDGMSHTAASHLFRSRILLGEIKFGDDNPEKFERDAHEPVLALDVFNRINARRVSRAIHSENEARTLGAGTLRCAGCRKVLHHKTPGMGNRNRDIYYCRDQKCPDRVMNLAAPDSNEILKGLAQEALGHLEGIVFETTGEDENRMAIIDAALDDLRAKSRQYAFLLAEDPTDQDLKDARREMKQRIVNMERERATIEAAERGLKATLMSDEIWQSTDAAGRIDAVRAVLDVVFVTPDGTMYPFPLGTYTEPLPGRGRSMPTTSFVPGAVHAPALAGA